MTAAIAVVAVFALVGVVSAAVFIVGQVSGSSSGSPKHSTGGGSTVVAQEISRARAQAAAIVAAAHKTSSQIVTSARRNTAKESHQIIASAKRKAAQMISSARASTGGSTKSSSLTGTGAASGPAVAATSPPASSNYTALPPGTPDLSRYPSTWQVVAYQVSFGSGPGDVGAVSIANRSKVPHSGTFRVYYRGGGSSRVIFNNLQPGQVGVFPLNGRAYHGQGYVILMKHLY
jgi:hypothetical protein